MKYTKKLGTLLGLALGLAAVGVAADAAAIKPKKPAVAEEAPTLPSAFALTPAKLAFGMKPMEVALVYDSVIDAEHLKDLQEAQPGVIMDRVLAQIQDEKRLFRRSVVLFSKLNTKYDATPLLSEYTYENQESMMLFERTNRTRYLFFMRDKLWKVIDEISVGGTSRYGADFAAAVAMLNRMLGVEGRARPADAAQGRPFDEVDWKSDKTHIRAINWGEGKVGLAYEEMATVDQLAQLRAAPAAATP